MRYFLVTFITVLFSLQAVGQNVSSVGNNTTGIPFGKEIADSTIKKGVINLLHIYKESKPDTTILRFGTVQKKMANRIFAWTEITIPVHIFNTNQAETGHIISYSQEETGRYFETHASDSLVKNQIRTPRILNQERAKP